MDRRARRAVMEFMEHQDFREEMGKKEKPEFALPAPLVPKATRENGD